MAQGLVSGVVMNVEGLEIADGRVVPNQDPMFRTVDVSLQWGRAL